MTSGLSKNVLHCKSPLSIVGQCWITKDVSNPNGTPCFGLNYCWMFYDQILFKFEMFFLQFISLGVFLF